MVTKHSIQPRRALTLVEVLVTSLLLGVVLTGMLAMMALTLGRMVTTSVSENDEKQLDRAQVELHYFVSRSSTVTILDASGSPSPSGNKLVCTLQPSPLERTPIKSVTFSLSSPSATSFRTFSVLLSLSDGTLKSYTYSISLIDQPEPMFSRTINGFIQITWTLDSGFGPEKFITLAAPRPSL